MLLLCAAVMMAAITACQSTAADTTSETTVSESAPTVGSTEAKVTAIPEPTMMAGDIKTTTAAPVDTPTTFPTDEPTATAEPTATSEPPPEPAMSQSYELVPEASEVRFLIDEELFGIPKTVVGRTNQVVGEILLDLQNTQEVEVGTIQVNARELATDDSFRNRALRRQILDSAQDAYQFITFTPTEIDGLSSEGTANGETKSFSLTGDLQIRDVVQSVTFEMMVAAISESELSGSGEAMVLRSYFDLQIPSVPGVANVSDEVRLEIDFTAESN